MPSPKKKPPTATLSVAGQSVADATLRHDNDNEDERVTARKVEMLQRRQVDLDILMDSHDDLVREAFQLEKFVTLLSYDPKVAKQDDSKVFLEYKTPHDLLSKTAAASESGRVSRKTRRATTEFRETLAATISAGPSTPPMTPSTPPKIKGKGRIISRMDSVSPIQKSIRRVRTQPPDSSLASSSAMKGKGKAKELPASFSSPNAATMPPPLHPPSKRDHHPRRVKDDVAQSPSDGSGSGAALSAPGTRILTRKIMLSRPSSPSSPDKANRTHRYLQDTSWDPASAKVAPSEPPEPPVAQVSLRPSIKRVRLFQRPRPAVYTHPSQLPPRPLHRNSVAEFLASFTHLEEGVDTTREELESVSYTEARTRARIRDLRRQGRLLLDIPDLPDGSIGISNLNVANDWEAHEVARNEDHYNHLVSAASRRGALVAAEYFAKRVVAERIAKAVVAWHKNKAVTDKKERKAEGLRIKTLAKLTMKEVEKQWKKAAMAVRDHNQAILAAEETRRGQKHLDAILDQSGAILEAQHSELSRARSRSSSARDWSDSEEFDGDVQDDAAASENDTGSEFSGDHMANEKEDDASAAWLLGTDALDVLGSRSSASELENGSVILDSDDIHSRASVPAESPSFYSESSRDALPVGEGEEADLSVSEAPSEVTLEDRPSTGVKTIPVTFSAVDTANGLISEGDEISRTEDPSEDHMVDPTNDESLNYSTSSYPRKGYRTNTPSSPSPHDRDNFATLLSPSTKSPIRTISSPQRQSQQLEPANLSSASETAIRAGYPMDALDTKEDTRPDSNGRGSVAVRLSNGVVIYRDVDASSSRGYSDDITAESRAHGDQFTSPPSGNPGLPISSPDVTQERDPNNVAEIQGISQHESEILELHPLPAEPASIVTNADDQTPLEASFTEDPGLTAPEQEVSDVGADDMARPAETNGVHEHDIDEPEVAPHLMEFAAAPVEWDTSAKVNPPFLLRGTLRPYQHSGLEWLASLHTNNLNGILADEMGLGKTIQTISLLAHLACDRGIWGPHLIVVPTSVLLNWEMEFKKFLPGFKILSYHGSTKRRKELRVGWNNKHHFNRKSWYYMILDEAHMIKNFKSQRWNILLMFRSFRRLLLTGTPLQNNLTELWALLQFLMSGTNFANLKEFGDWFSNPLEKAIEQGTILDEETQERVKKLHTVLRPYLLRRLKADVEKELPSKYEHLVMCRLSKRQRFLYDEFMARAQTRDALSSGVYHKVANILMQLRKVCNHPDLFEVRPIVTSFAMPRSATVDFEIKELLVRRRFLKSQEDSLNLDFLGLAFVQHQNKSIFQARSTRVLDASSSLPFITELPGEPPPVDTRTIEGFKRHMKHQQQLSALRQWTHLAYVNRLRCAPEPISGSETISIVRRLSSSLRPVSNTDFRRSDYLDRSRILPTLIKSYARREEEMAGVIDRFAFVTPPAVARDISSIALSGFEPAILQAQDVAPEIDAVLHRASVKLQIAFPEASLIQYDCGKLQELASLLHKRKAGGHRVLIFTQMTKVLDILEIFLNFHGYRYLRLDGATKIEDRQYITERFNTDDRVFAFIASSRSGGVGINLTGADTVVFYDSDFNPQMDRQCEDRAHRIGQIRDVHIYRFISEHTVEESMLRKANQKRSLDNIVIQQGEFDWRSLLIDDEAFGKALGEFEDKEDAHAARVAAREEAVKAVEDRVDFAGETDEAVTTDALRADTSLVAAPEEEEVPEEDGTIADYMLAFVKRDWDYFSVWR